ncbi:MAG: succinate dehydrogenase, cytochrome b556 subunit [bacterium]
MAVQKYSWHVGFLSWFLHRVTGVLLSVYLVIHVWVVSTVSHGPAGFNQVMAAVQTPMFIFFEVCLLGTVLYHSLNGMRLLIVDTGLGVRHQKGLLFLLMGIGMILFVIGAFPILRLLGMPFPL